MQMSRGGASARSTGKADERMWRISPEAVRTFHSRRGGASPVANVLRISSCQATASSGERIVSRFVRPIASAAV